MLSISLLTNVIYVLRKELAVCMLFKIVCRQANTLVSKLPESQMTAESNKYREMCATVVS